MTGSEANVVQISRAKSTPEEPHTRQISREEAIRLLEAVTDPGSHYWGKIEFHFENSEVKRVQANTGMVRLREVREFVHFIKHGME